jgi:hypothetical protein
VAETDDGIPKINPSEIETLINKIEQNTLSEQDKRKITRLLRTLLYVVGMLQEKKITLLRLKEKIFGKKSEKMKRGEGEKGEPKDGCVDRDRAAHYVYAVASDGGDAGDVWNTVAGVGAIGEMPGGGQRVGADL